MSDLVQTQTARLTGELHGLPDGSEITIYWDDETGKRFQANGTIAEFDPAVPCRCLETDERNLLLTPTRADGVSVVELTPSGSTHLGTLQHISPVNTPSADAIRITDAGVEVPPELVGYTGLLRFTDFYGKDAHRIVSPGLEPYDDRLLMEIPGRPPPVDYEPTEVTIKPTAGPKRWYAISDERATTTQYVEDSDTSSRPNYDAIETAIGTVVALDDAIRADREVRMSSLVANTLFDLRSTLLTTRRALLEPGPDDDFWDRFTELDVRPWDDYHDALEAITQELETLEASIDRDETLSSTQSERIEKTLHEARADLETLHTLFSMPHRDDTITSEQPLITDTAKRTPMTEHDDTTHDDDHDSERTTTTAPPSRATTEGRGHGDGRWLEYQLERAFERWGYHAETQQTVFSLEADVVATRREKQHKPTDWLLAQCKDWTSRPITPEVVYRLCMLAFTCGAMPVLCHTTELTARAQRVARDWEVRVLTLEDLHRGDLPAPNVCRPTNELFEYTPQYTARERRGSLPPMFAGEPGKQLSYAPGFEPYGRTHEYQPIGEDESEKDEREK